MDQNKMLAKTVRRQWAYGGRYSRVQVDSWLGSSWSHRSARIKVLPTQPGSFQPSVIPTLSRPVKAARRARGSTQSQIHWP